MEKNDTEEDMSLLASWPASHRPLDQEVEISAFKISVFFGEAGQRLCDNMTVDVKTETSCHFFFRFFHSYFHSWLSFSQFQTSPCATACHKYIFPKMSLRRNTKKENLIVK